MVSQARTRFFLWVTHLSQVNKLSKSIWRTRMCCPEKWWYLCPWRYSEAVWTWSWAIFSRCPPL